jgi:hypothetical protein
VKSTVTSGRREAISVQYPGWTPQAVYRFVGGRNRHNARRREMGNHRRAVLLCKLVGLPRPLPWGYQAALAKALGVSTATICRDLRLLASPSYKMPRLKEVPGCKCQACSRLEQMKR